MHNPVLVAEVILYMRPANEGRRYNVKSSLIGLAHALYQCMDTAGGP